MGRPVVHFEICVEDYPKHADFYSKAFGWNIDDNNPMHYGVITPGGEGGIGGGLMKVSGMIRPYLTFYIDVDNIEDSLKTIESLGGQTAVPPMDIPGVGRTAFFKDPQGHIIGLYTPAARK
jgi:hypothetical protein